MRLAHACPGALRPVSLPPSRSLALSRALISERKGALKSRNTRTHGCWWRVARGRRVREQGRRGEGLGQTQGCPRERVLTSNCRRRRGAWPLEDFYMVASSPSMTPRLRQLIRGLRLELASGGGGEGDDAWGSGGMTLLPV